MNVHIGVAGNQLEAKSPFELRASLGKDVPESVVKRALETGEMGFLHSFTTGSTVVMRQNMLLNARLRPKPPAMPSTTPMTIGLSDCIISMATTSRALAPRAIRIPNSIVL